MRTLSQETRVKPSEAMRSPPEGDARSHQGSLRSKLVLSLAAIFFVFLLIDDVVRRRVIEPEFIALERGGAIRDANRVLAALNSEVEHLAELASHWAAQIRDDEAAPTRRSVASRDPIAWPMAKSDWVARGRVRRHMVMDSVGNRAIGMQNSMVRESTLRSLVQSCREAGEQVTSGMTRIDSQTLVMVAIIALGDPSLPIQAGDDALSRGCPPCRRRPVGDALPTDSGRVQIAVAGSNGFLPWDDATCRTVSRR